MERYIAQQQTGHFDLIIIGGGITGAALAYEAGMRGLKTALFEKSDYGAATSSATSKLIHGGLRYLKNMEFGLVRESLRERRILSDIAPNFVYPMPFMVPAYRSFKSRKGLLFLAMEIYDLLSYDKGKTRDPNKRLPRFYSYGRRRTLAEEPCVNPDGLTGAMVYYDCQNIFPERMTLAFLKSAEEQGCALSNYAEVVSFIRNGKRVEGVRVKDGLTGAQGRFTAPVTVNCAGPWADLVVQKAISEQAKHKIRRSEGIHIITRKICHRHAVTVMTKKERHIMVMPWRNYTLIGTTDKEYHGNPDDYRVTKSTILELLQDVNDNFAGAGLKYEDVLFYYGGLRPLADTDTENSYASSRKYEIFDNAGEGLEGLFTVEGGKYTTSRQLAVDVLKRVEKKRKVKWPAAVSHKRYLYGSKIENMVLFLQKLYLEYPDFSRKTVEYLGKNYGTECHNVFRIARKNSTLAEVLNEDGEILAEVAYALNYESAYTLSDIFFRRTGLGTAGCPGKTVINKVADMAAAYLGWDEKKRRLEIQHVLERFRLPED